MLRTTQPVTTNHTTFYNTPTVTEFTTSFLHTIANSIGWLNPFQSRAQGQLSKVLVTSLLLMQSFGAAERSEPYNVCLKSNVASDAFNLNSVNLACNYQSEYWLGGYSVDFRDLYVSFRDNCNATIDYSSWHLRASANETNLDISSCLPSLETPIIMFSYSNTVSGINVRNCTLRYYAGFEDACVTQQVMDQVNINFIKPSIRTEQQLDGDFSAKVIDMILAGTGALLAAGILSKAACMGYTHFKARNNSAQLASDPELRFDERYNTICDRLVALADVNDDRLNQLRTQLENFKEMYRRPNTLLITSKSGTFGNASSDKDGRFNATIATTIKQLLSSFETQLTQIEKDKPKALNRIVII